MHAHRKRLSEKDLPTVVDAQKGAQRPMARFVLCDPHPLAKTHMLVKKAKWGAPALAGAAPPKRPADGERR